MYCLAFCLLADVAQSVRANRHILSYIGIIAKEASEPFECGACVPSIRST